MIKKFISALCALLGAIGCVFAAGYADAQKAPWWSTPLELVAVVLGFGLFVGAIALVVRIGFQNGREAR